MKDTPEKNVRAAVTPEAVEAAIRRRGRKGMTVRMLVEEVVAEHRIGRSEARHLLRQSLRSLLREGRVVEGRGKRYFVAGASDLLTGVLRRRRDGDVVEVAGSREGPVHIPPKALHGALDGDQVLVRLETAGKQAREAGWREGVVVRVLERARTTVVGRWVTEPGRPHVRPLDDKLRLRIYPTAFTDVGEPAPGEFVMITLESVSTQGRSGRGAVVEHMGRLGEPGVEERVVLRVHGIPETYPNAVLTEAEALPATISPADLKGRRDLRDRPVITIDPETARDFDDAINARRARGDDIVVEVHIADVSHYVAEGSELDAEARRRGTSVYLPGLCIAMLPERVSNELCSLREAEDRLVYTVRYTVRRDGSLARVEAAPAVIRSRRRCTYGEVFSWLETPRESWPDETAEFADSLAAAAEAAERLGRLRRRRGSLDFDLAEPEFLLDPEGRVVSIEASARNRAHRLIEELMVAANRCVAQLLVDADQPALHRVHDRPDPTRVEELEAALLGARLPPGRQALRAAPHRPAAGPGGGRRKAGGAAGGDVGPAHPGPGALQPGAAGALRSGRRRLSPLHLAHSPLPRPGGAPHAAPPRSRQRAGSGRRKRGHRGRAGHPWRELLGGGAAGRGGGADGGAVEDHPLPAGP